MPCFMEISRYDPRVVRMRFRLIVEAASCAFVRHGIGELGLQGRVLISRIAFLDMDSRVVIFVK